MQIYKTKQEVEKIAKNLYKQGKSSKEVKQAISLYLKESKKRINPNNEDLF